MVRPFPEELRNSESDAVFTEAVRYGGIAVLRREISEARSVRMVLGCIDSGQFGAGGGNVSNHRSPARPAKESDESDDL